MKNHLFIGLGGQGGRSLAELRKVIHQREEDAANLNNIDVAWDYLYIDSSKDVSNARQYWTHLGVNLSLAPSQSLYLRDGGNLPSADNLAIIPEIAPWIGDTHIVDGWMQGAAHIQGANQRRRFGRILFANNVSRVVSAVNEKVERLTNARHQSCAFHIFASLAGGTGSGSIIDMVTLIRSQFSGSDVEDGHPIFLYLYVTSNNAQGADVGYFYENQYAALRDLNALAVERLQPTMLAGNRRGNPFAGSTPINGIVLASNVSDRNRNHSLERQIRTLSEAAFERILCYCSGDLNQNQQKALTGEDRYASATGEPARRPLRSYRFGSLGMRRWEIPVEEIQELVANELYLSAFRQMLYENWQDGEGYQGNAGAGAMPQATSLVDHLNKRMDSELLTQRELPRLKQAFEKDADNILKGTLRKGHGEEMLQVLTDTIETHYYSAFQEGGVDNAFHVFSTRRNARLENVETAIHEAIATAWNANVSSVGLSLVPQLLSRIQQELRISLADGPENSVAGNSRIKARLSDRILQWNKITALSAMMGKRNQLAEAHLSDLRSTYLDDLTARAAAEDRKFIDTLIGRIGVLQQKYANAVLLLRDFEKAAQDRRDVLWGGLQGMKVPEDANKYEFDLDSLKLFIQEATRDRNQMTGNAELLRSELARSSNGGVLSTLANLSMEQKGVLWERMDTICFSRVKSIHQEFLDAERIRPILGSSLMDRLQSKHQADPEQFKQEMQEFLDNAASCLKVAHRADQVLAGNLRSPRHLMVVGLPSNHRFSAELRQLLTSLTPAGRGVEFGSYTHDDPTQIRLLVIYCWMAVRQAPVVDELQSNYTNSVAHNTDGEIAYFANIDPHGETDKRPSLLKPTAEELRLTLSASLWLGKRLKIGLPPEALIQENPRGAYLIIQRDEALAPQELGRNLAAFEASADTNGMELVDSAVVEAVAALSDEQAQALRDEIRAEDRELQAQLGILDLAYIKWTKVRDELNRRLSQ